MTDALRLALSDLLRKAQIEADADFLREGMRVFAQAVMELEVTQQVGAERHVRTGTRTGQRNGYRERTGTRGWERLRCTFRVCATAVTFRPCSIRAAMLNVR